MKRFLVSPPGTDMTEAATASGHKRPRVENESVAPRTFLSWNLNGLYCRLKAVPQWNEFAQLVEQQKPDTIALQEVR